MYELISDNDWGNKIINMSRIEFFDNEIDIIKKLSKKYTTSQYRYSIAISDSYIEISIDKFDDEWFFIRERTFKFKHYSNNNRSQAETECKYYKCDQIDGLIQFLKERL